MFKYSITKMFKTNTKPMNMYDYILIRCNLFGLCRVYTMQNDYANCNYDNL